MTVIYNDLCSCCSNDLAICCKGTFCPCWLNTCTAYQISTQREMGCCECWCVPFTYTPFYNRKILNKNFGFENSNFIDCITVCCCYPCSVCQNENNLRQLIESNDHSITVYN